jgi:hypothetical protein
MLAASAFDPTAARPHSGLTAGTAPARVVAIIPARPAWLTVLDARTLKPASRAWSLKLASWRSGDPAVLSPSGSRVAVIVGNKGRDSVLVVATATGRTLRRVAVPLSDEFYWLGGEGTSRHLPALLVQATVECASGGMVGGVCSSKVGIPWASDPRRIIGWQIYPESYVWSVLRTGVVLGGPPPGSVIVWPNGTELVVSRMQDASTFTVASDVGGDRLYAITWTGLVAAVARASAARPVVSYHRVGLDGGLFAAGWAGQGRIALWGDNGLGTIDTRTWTTQAVAADVRHALPTRYGIAAWTDGPDGLTVYQADGRLRLRLLAGRQITGARSIGAYLYADTTTNSRYSIDLRTGRTTGPLPTTARSSPPASRRSREERCRRAGR